MKKAKPPLKTGGSGTKAPPKPEAKSKSAVSQDEITQSAAFRRATADAEAYAKDPKRLKKLVQDAVGKINHIPRGPFVDTWPYLMAMIRLVRAYREGEYRDVPASKLLTILSALIYFVSPFDVIPDWIPVFGHIDDAFVISLALKSVRDDLDTFMAWETARV